MSADEGCSKREKQLLDRIKAQDAELDDLRRQIRRLKQLPVNDIDEAPCADEGTTEAPPPVRASRLRPSPGCEPPALEGHAGVAYDGKVIVFGGTPAGSKIPVATLHGLNIPNGKWKVVECQGDMPAARHGHTCTLMGKSMIVFGGITADGISGTMYELDLVGNKWSQVDPHTQKAGGIEQVKGHSASLFHRKLYVFGGVTPTGRTNLIHCFDVAKGEWLPTAELNTQARNQASGKGSSGSKPPAVASPPSHADEDASILPPSSKDVSEEEAHIPTPRSGHSSCTYGRKSSLVVFGGRTSATTCSNEVFVYCTSTKEWTQMYCGGESVPSARCDHSALIAGDMMYVFAGYSVDGGAKQYHNDLHVLNLVTYTWTVLAIEGKKGVPSPGCSRLCCLFEDPDGQLCLLSHGGWTVSKSKAEGSDGNGDDGSVACASSSETWVLRLAAHGIADTKIARHQPAPPPSKSLIRLTTSSKARNGTLPPATARPDTSGQTSPRAQTRGGTDESRPWISQTSKAQSARFFDDPLSAPVPPPPEKPKRPKEDIESIVGRLSNMAIIESRKQKLANRYLYNGMRKEVPPLTAEEQEESVNRLYYEQMQYREERMAELENNFYPPPEPKDHDEDEMYDMIERLSVQPPHRQPNAAASSPSPMSSVGAAASRGGVEKEGAVVATPEQIKECVNRMYYEQQERSRKKRLELEERYLSRPVTKPSPRRTADEMNGIIDRLNNKGV